MSAIVLPAQILEARRAERERMRRLDQLAFEGSILAEVCETKKPATEPIGDTAKWLKQILKP